MIGDNIRRKRKEKGLTLDDLGKQVGVSRQTIQRYESGVISNIPSDKIVKMAGALGCSPSDLMGWDKKNDNNILPITGMVPIVGTIPAGAPVLATENVEGYMPTLVKNPEEYFALRVHGKSMINAGIPDGSLVLIHQQPCAENGQIVACRINGDEATLKRFKQIGDTVVLMPENPDFQPIVVKCSDFENGYAEIIGIAKQVITDLK
jgi:repressor LexA